MFINKLIANLSTELIYPDYTLTFEVDDSKPSVDILLEVWDQDGIWSGDDICDISPAAGGGDDGHHSTSNVNLRYYLTTGQWKGDDEVGDANGYGHVSGNEDGSIGQANDEDDVEMWFDIYMNCCVA